MTVFPKKPEFLRVIAETYYICTCSFRRYSVPKHNFFIYHKTMAHLAVKSRIYLFMAALVFFAVSFTQVSSQTVTYKRGAIMEEYTGTWCPHCPPGAWAMDTMQKTYGDNLVEIAW